MARWLIVGAVVVGVAGVAMMASRGGELPEPLWTLEDLPETPPAEDNGWPILMANEGSVEVVEVVEVEGADSIEIELESDLELDARWQELDAQSDRIRERVSRNAAVLERWRQAAKAPEFVDACPLSFDSHCMHFQGFQIHQEALAEVVHLGLSEDWAAADRALVEVLEVDRRLLESCRGLMACTVAVENVERTVGAADLVLSRQAGVDELRDERGRVVTALEAHRGLDHDAVIERMVIGEYLYMRSVLEAMTQTRGDALREQQGWPSALLFDPEKTSRVMDELHRELLVRARGGTVEDPVEWSFLDRMLNSLGTTLVDVEMIRQLSGPRFEQTEGDLRRIANLRDAVIRRWDEA